MCVSGICGGKSVMWRKFRFLYMTDVEKSEISSHLACVWCGEYLHISTIMQFCRDKILWRHTFVKWGGGGRGGWVAGMLALPCPKPSWCIKALFFKRLKNSGKLYTFFSSNVKQRVHFQNPNSVFFVCKSYSRLHFWLNNQAFVNALNEVPKTKNFMQNIVLFP